MSSVSLVTLEEIGLQNGIFVPIEIAQFQDTTCPFLLILVYDFDEIVKQVFRREGRGGEIPPSFDCLKFSSEQNQVYFIEMKRFREMREKFLSLHTRDQHMPLVNRQVQMYSTKIPGKMKGTLEAFELLQKQFGVTVDADHQKKFFVLTDISRDDQQVDYVDLTLYTLQYLSDETTPLDDFIQLRMLGMINDSFTGDEKPILVSCSTLEKHINS